MRSVDRKSGRRGAAYYELLMRFTSEEGGQDLVEYALLAAFLGVAGWAVLMTIPNTMSATYSSWLNPTSGVPGLWNPPEPASAGS